MTYIPVDNTCQVEMVYVYQGQFCENVFHVLQSAEWTISDLNTIAGDFISWYNTSYKSQVSNSMALTKVKARDLSQQFGFGIEAPVSPAVAGTKSGQPLPTNCALAIKWTTGLAGRSFRGRTYHMGLTVDDVFGSAPDVMLATPLANIITAYNDLMSAVNIGDRNLVVVSRFSANAPRTTGVATVITAVNADNVLDSQRRRLVGRGA